MYEVYAINQAASAARGLVLEAARERGDPNIYNIYMGSPLFLDSSSGSLTGSKRSGGYRGVHIVEGAVEGTH